MLACVAAAPRDMTALSGLAREYREQGLFAESHAIALRLLERAPSSPHGHIELAMLAPALRTLPSLHKTP